MIWHTLSTDYVISKLLSDKKLGLSSDEAESRINLYGKNEIAHREKSGIFKKIISQFNDYMIIILIIAAIVSFAISLYEGKNDYVEPIVIISIIIVNALIGIIQEQKAENALSALYEMTKPTTLCIRNGIPQKICSSELVYGDIIMLKRGDYVPADARLISCNELYTDESALTGESHPILKNSEIKLDEGIPIADMKNMIWSSTSVTNGNCIAIVTETGMSTQVGKIASAIIDGKAPQTPLQAKLEQTGRLLGSAALIICMIVFIAGVFKKIPPIEMFMTAVSLAVAAIPEGLPAIVTVMLAMGVKKMAGKNAIVRKLPAVETLGSASVICSDKTGTLTQNKMTVTYVFGNEREVISTALLCSNNTDSTEKAIVAYSNKKSISIHNGSRIKEIPFNSTSKYMATINKVENGYFIAVKGAFDVLIKKCKMSPDERQKSISEHNKMTSKALRVIAVAGCCTDYMPNMADVPLQLFGLIGIADPPRPEIRQAISICKRAGIKPVMITGDHINTACAVAEQIGMSHSAISGTEIDKMSDSELKQCVKNHSVFARVTPNHKVRIVKAFQSNGEVVAMTGDGVNDAPALKQADIGCAMGITGTDVAKGAADMILTDDNFATIVEAVKEGRGIFANIKKSIHFLLSSNMGEILTIFCAIIVGLPSPLTAVQLLWVNLITDSLPAIALGMDTNNKLEIMSQKPIKRSKGIFADGQGLLIFLEGIMIGTLALLAFCIGYYKYQSTDIGRTMSFCVLSISQLIHSFNVRSDKSVFSGSSTANYILYTAVALGILLQLSVVLSPILSYWFGTVYLNIPQWQTVGVLSIIPLLIVEASKLLLRRERPF